MSAQDASTRNAGGARAFVAPGPGAWGLDAAHCERPRSRYMHDVFGRAYAPGFRAGFERYGAMLDTIEYAPVQGFPYTSVRPLGAPPDAKGPPPRFVLKLMAWLHPSLRRRVRRAEEVLRERPWRDDFTRYYDESRPALEARLIALAADPVDELSPAEFARHFSDAHGLVDVGFFDHFRFAGASILPVGDFLAHAIEWTGCSPDEALALLRGSSPDSIALARQSEAVADAVRSDPEALRILEGDDAAGRRLQRLRALPGAAGDAVRAWIERVGHRIVTGCDISELTGLETPEALVASLAGTPLKRRVEAPTEDKARALIARAPEAHRETLAALLEEARMVYRLRDGRSCTDLWTLGVLRRAVLEAGRRLVVAGKIDAPDHAVQLTYDEINALLGGASLPSRAEVSEHARWRSAATVADAPPWLGAPPSPPPPSDWLPPAAARIDRAFAAYFRAMMTEATRTSDARVIQGIPASPGHYTGTARLVLEPGDFSRVQQGDVLVARMTAPTYNVLLPLVGAVVTDRGGLLSHPAIVAREFGVPGVVGCRDATTHIHEGARVEVDGDAGTITVLG